MKTLFKIGILLLLAACKKEKVELPADASLHLQMFTVGADRFEQYIRSLNIYAFRRTAGGEYVYHSTLAQLDSSGVVSLQDASGRKDSKLFKTRLEIGEYELYFVANAREEIEGEWQPGVTLPREVMIRGKADGEEKVYFLGHLTTRVVSEYMSPVQVTLSRAVGKLVLVLRNVPSQLAEIRLSLGNIARAVAIDGSLTEDAVEIEKVFKRPSMQTVSGDTVIYQLITLPSREGGSPFSMTFRSRSGEEKVKKMPDVSILPDKYIRLTGEISDAPGALLSFSFVNYYFIFDKWENIILPDFSLMPVEL